jgi:2-dehydro-3-deoxyphosphogluconate aldolase/(4S)-4-hydroxy-2-oxoglutarate aldolase
MSVQDDLKLAPVIPVLTIERLEDAVPLARALVAGGLRVLEVTLRTPVALEAMARIGDEVGDAIVAAGTVLTAADRAAAAKAGARFAFSPGLADFMLEGGPVPMVPGIATPSELMRGLERGITTFKFFPAVPAGGADALKALGGPFPDVKFCPTGGIDAARAKEFLSLPNVLCVGGSWIAPSRSIAAQDWTAITANAKAASALR